ncbi:MAG: glycoside hydrolase family 5 protein [Legionellaceae bacterium]
MSYLICLGLTKAYATLPLEFTSTPTFPITIAQHHASLLEYTIKNNTPIALPLSITTTPASSLVVQPLGTTCGTSLLQPKQQCQLSVLMYAGNQQGIQSGTIKINYQGRTPLQSQARANVLLDTSPGNILLGYNLSGFEFASTPTPGNYPTTADATTFAKTFSSKIIRVPFRMEYCTDSDGNINNPIYLNAVNDFVQNLINNNGDIQVLLDMHNYMRYCPNASAGSCGTFLTGTALGNAWKNIANYLPVVKNNPNTVWLDLMNEPNGIPAQQAFDNEIAAFIALRQSNINNPIALEGTEWTGLHSWVSSGNASVFTVSAINSALQNAGVNPGQYAIEVHQYLDYDFSGTSPVCVDNATLNDQINFSEFTQWLQSNHVPVILGETGGGLNQVCIDDMSTLYDDAVQNPYSASAANGGFSAITYWGGGQAWGNSYFLGIQPISSLNTQGMIGYFAPAQLYLSLTQLHSQNSINPLMTTIPADNYTSFGVCFSSLYTINLTNDFPVGQSTGNLQFLTGSSTVDAPMSTSMQNTTPDSDHDQLETLCLPTSATTLYLYPSPQYAQKSISLSTASVQPYDASQAQ